MRITRTLSSLALGTALTLSLGTAATAQDKELESIGISVGLLGNPFFVATIEGIEDRAREINPDVQITSVSADYDLNKQVSQIENFIAAGVDIIMLNAVDDEAIAPAVMRAKQAGIVVAAFDVSAPGADVTVMTDNIAAGRKACEYIVEQLNGTGYFYCWYLRNEFRIHSRITMEIQLLCTLGSDDYRFLCNAILF